MSQENTSEHWSGISWPNPVVQECGRCGLMSPPLPADEASRWAKDHVFLCPQTTVVVVQETRS